MTGTWVSDEDQEQVDVAVDILEIDGPIRGRPLVDTITQSRHTNMKELRPPSTSIRILFAFDPRRTAILLLGGDKQGQWTQWYDRNVPIADVLYTEHLQALEKEGRL